MILVNTIVQDNIAFKESQFSIYKSFKDADFPRPRTNVFQSSKEKVQQWQYEEGRGGG